MARPRAVVVVTVLAAASVAGWWLGEQRRTANPQVRVVEAIDGDTIVVAFADGHTDTIRILGIDTPNVAQHHLRRGEGTTVREWVERSPPTGGAGRGRRCHRRLESPTLW